MANPSSTQLGPPTDRISLLALFQYINEYFGAHHLGALEGKVLGGDIRTWVRWHSGSQPAWLLHGKFGDFLGEEEATPELLNKLCQGMGFHRLLQDDAIYAGDNNTAFVVASRSDAAQFWPWPETLSQPVTAPVTPSGPETSPANQPTPLEPADWIRKQPKKSDESARQYARRIEPEMVKAHKDGKVKRFWKSRTIENRISDLDLLSK